MTRVNRAPFTRTLQRARRRTVPVTADVLMRDGRRVRLSGRLRACGSAAPRFTG